jgi:antitoxin component YwqK of YwqJK toxin-antitoxin module
MNSNYHFEDISFSGEILVTGPKNGVYETRYSNKKIKSLKTYVNGKLHGLCQSYDLYGNLLTESNYKNDMLHGMTKIYHSPKIEGTVEPKIHKVIYYKNNVKTGLEKIYLQDGTLFITYDHSYIED